MKFVYLCKNLNKNMTTKITFLRSLILLVTICVNSSLYALTFSTATTNANCFGENTGSIVVSVSDAVGTCYYSLNENFSPQQTSNTFNLSAGTYSVYIKDDNGTYGPDNVTIGEPSKIEISPAVTHVTCPGSATGQIIVTANGGSRSYDTYSLVGENLEYESINTTGTFKNLLQGKYTASVKDNNGCVAKKEAIEIKEPETLTINPLTSNPAANVACENSKTASVTFTVVGRIEEVATTDTTRYYSVKLFDITNQHEISGPNLRYTNKFHPVLTKPRVEQEPVLDANGDPTYDEEGNPITNKVTYKDTLWTDGCHEPTKVIELAKYGYDETIKGFDCNDKITVSGLGAGAYSISFYKGECEFAGPITFTVGVTGKLPTVQINSTGSFCDESEYTISPTVVSNPKVTKYQWTLGDAVIGEEEELTRIFTLEDNNKSLKLSVTNSCGTTTSNTTLIQVNKRPTAILTSKNKLCNSLQSEVAINFTGEGPFTYTLPDNTVKTTTDVSVTEEIVPSGNTEYTLIALKDQNCAAIAEKDINILNINQPDILTVEPLTKKPAATVVCEADKTASVTFTVVGRTEEVAITDTTRYYSVKLFDITNQYEIIAPNLKHTNKFHPVLTKNRVEKEPVLDANGDPTFDDEGNPITKNVTYKDTLWTDGCHEPTKVIELAKYGYDETMKGFDCNDKITVSGLGAGAYSISFYKGECEFAGPVTFTVGVTGKLPTVQINEIGSFCDESEYTIIPTIESNPIVKEYKWTLDDIEIKTGKIKNAQELTDSINLKRIFTLDDNNKKLKIDITNQCGSTTSNSVLVKVNKRPTAILETNKNSLCNSLQTEVAINFTGKGPFTYTLPDGTEKSTAEVSVIEEIVPFRDTEFTLISLKDQNCTSIVEKDINTIEIIQPEILTVEAPASTPAATVICETDKTASVTFTIVGRTEEVAATDSLTYYSIKLYDINNQQEIIDTDFKYTQTFQDSNDHITVSELGAGAYSISFIKGDCEFVEPITFTIGITGNLPIVSINEIGSFCNETVYTVSPNIESKLDATQYEWTLNDIIIGEEKDLTRKFTLEDNNQSLKLSITNLCGTTTSNSVLIQVNQRPTAVLETSKHYLCKNQPTEVSITLTGAGPFTYTLPDGTEKTVEDVFSKEEIIPVRDTVFTLTSLKDQNCESIIEKDINTVETKIYPEPEYDMTITVPEPMVSGRYVVVNANEGFVDYSLFINDEEIAAKGPSNLFWSKKFPYGTSTNEFKMEFTDENGCIWQLEETRTIESITFPNIFTPNGDGVNDIFLADYDLKVYDRQGTLMYEGTEGWDGTHNGMEANPGVYLYTVFISNEEGNLEVIKSTLTLER